jgi:hypothetical protein
MPQDQNPIAPQDPQGGNSAPHKPSVDPKSFLLPKKEVHAPENATRVNAGALLEAEQSATLPKPEPAAPVTPAPAPKKEESVVKPIETYQSAIESVVEKNKVSVVSIAAAEAKRRNMDAIREQPAFQSGTPLWRKIAFIGAGAMLLIVSLALVLVALKPAPTVQVSTPDQAPFINVDETKLLTVPSGALDHAAFVQALEGQRKGVSLSLGLISRFYIATQATSSGAQPELITSQKLLQALSPAVPGTLLRAIDDYDYLLGVHSYDSNQPFLILKVDSYEQAFSAMLEWEPTMRRDLSPLFTRTPQLYLSGATSTSEATSTQASSTPPAAPIQTGFIDRVVENYDARVVQNDPRDILFLWTFLNRSTLVITTNEATLREVISRLRDAPIVPTP